MRPRLFVLTAAALLTMAAGTSQAASIGPDAFGYSATNGIPFVFHDISGTGTRVLAGTDDSTASAAIGFTFNFYGTGYSNLFISTNGLLSFTGGNGAFTNSDLTSGIGNTSDLPTIAALWDDWETFTGGDAVYYETTGAPGSRVMTVEWRQIHGYIGSPGTITFEAQLFEGSGNILLRYLNTNDGDFRAFGANATVGIRNTGAPGNGDVLQWSFHQGVIPDESSILITAGPVVPEPASLVLLGTGIALVARSLRRR